jgi:hypothetical protein
MGVRFIAAMGFTTLLAPHSFETQYWRDFESFSNFRFRPTAVNQIFRYQPFKIAGTASCGPAWWVVWGATVRSRCQPD